MRATMLWPSLPQPIAGAGSKLIKQSVADKQGTSFLEFLFSIRSSFSIADVTYGRVSSMRLKSKSEFAKQAADWTVYGTEEFDLSDWHEAVNLPGGFTYSIRTRG